MAAMPRIQSVPKLGRALADCWLGRFWKAASVARMNARKARPPATISGKKAAVAIPSKLNDPLRTVSSKCSISRKQFQFLLSMA